MIYLLIVIALTAAFCAQRDSGELSGVRGLVDESPGLCPRHDKSGYPDLGALMFKTNEMVYIVVMQTTKHVGANGLQHLSQYAPSKRMNGKTMVSTVCGTKIQPTTKTATSICERCEVKAA